MDRLRTEPALIVAVVTAAINLGLSFGLALTDTQQGAIMAFVILVAGVITRQSVYPAFAPDIEHEEVDPDDEPKPLSNSEVAALGE